VIASVATLSREEGSIHPSPGDPRESNSLDLLCKTFLLVCAALFALAVSLRLNGSSIFTWKELLRDNATSGGLLLSTPQPVRSDEWMVWTPAAIAQYEHGFPVENPALGAGKAPFLYSLPVRHYTMLFRPQLYGFFLLPLEWGYAWYWNVKVFGLLVAMFLLFRMLTGNSLIALFGSVWVFFSNYIQWWFSCPPMLPEMLSSWAVALVAAITVFRSRRVFTRLCATGTFVVTTLNFALCLYPPFQIPLLYLWLLIFGAFLYSRERNQQGRGDWQAPFYLIGGAVLSVLLLVPFFVELRPTFELLAASDYPGGRRSYGGELSWMHLFSGLMNFFNSESAYPERFKQANEAANFFPLWLPVLACTARDLVRHPRKHAIGLVCLGLILSLSIYALSPLPQWLCHVTLLSYCTEARSLLAIGVANIVFVLVTLPLLKARLEKKEWRWTMVIVAAVFCVIFLYLRCSVFANPTFLVPWRAIMLLLIDTGVVFALITGRFKVFAIGFGALLVATNALVNPVMVGLDPLLRSSPGVTIRELVRKDPAAAWVAYDSNPNSELLLASGANVLSGVKVVPDLMFYRLFDPEGRDKSAYNRYSFAHFVFRRDRKSVGIRYVAFPTHLVSIHPLNAALRVRNVRYFLFTRPFLNPATEGIELVRALPQNRIWIYRVIS
jgi:hypothetical protein